MQRVDPLDKGVKMLTIPRPVRTDRLTELVAVLGDVGDSEARAAVEAALSIPGADEGGLYSLAHALVAVRKVAK